MAALFLLPSSLLYCCRSSWSQNQKVEEVGVVVDIESRKQVVQS